MGQRTRILGYQEPGQLKKENAFTAYHAEKRFLFEQIIFRECFGYEIDGTRIQYEVVAYAVRIIQK